MRETLTKLDKYNKTMRYTHAYQHNEFEEIPSSASSSISTLHSMVQTNTDSRMKWTVFFLFDKEHQDLPTWVHSFFPFFYFSKLLQTLLQNTKHRKKRTWRLFWLFPPQWPVFAPEIDPSLTKAFSLRSLPHLRTIVALSLVEIYRCYRMARNSLGCDEKLKEIDRI